MFFGRMQFGCMDVFLLCHVTGPIYLSSGRTGSKSCIFCSLALKIRGNEIFLLVARK